MTPERYHAQRIRLGYTQGELAKLLGVSRQTIARRETDKQVITREAWLAIRSLPPKR